MSSLFNNLKKVNSQNVTTLMNNFALKLSNYASLKRFSCLNWIPKKFSTILHSQFNYQTLPVTPFNLGYCKLGTLNEIGCFLIIMFIKNNINIFKGCIPKSSRKEDDIYRRSAFRNRTGNETIKCYKKILF